MKKIYEKIYRKIKISFIAKIFAFLYYLLIWIKYRVGKKRKKIESIISKETAINKISEIYKIPDIYGEVCEQVANNNICYDLSIIIPAYNAESFIEECLESIITQNTKYQFEIIVINDGSTDKTEKIIERYANINNVVIIKQENQGIAASRNRGIDISKGKYIMFVDADDKLVQDAVEVMLDCAKVLSADIVQGGYIRFSTDKKYYQKFRTDYVRNIKEDEKLYLFQGYPWGKIFKRELWNSVRFPKGFWFEDTIIKLILYNLANTITICDKLVYEYRANDSGISSLSKKKEKSLDAFFVVEKILNSAKANRIQFGCQNSYCEWFFKEQITGLLWNRIQFMDDNVKECVFILIVDMVEKNNIVYQGKDKLTREICSAISDKDYNLWKNCAKYMSYQV